MLLASSGEDIAQDRDAFGSFLLSYDELISVTQLVMELLVLVNAKQLRLRHRGDAD